jgi:hypothetical protein
MLFCGLTVTDFCEEVSGVIGLEENSAIERNKLFSDEESESKNSECMIYDDFDA